MEPIRLGILGAGSFAARRILPILSSIPSIIPVCIHNRTMKKAEEFGRKYGIPYAVDSRAALLAVSELDAIYITSPNHLHEEDAIACAAAKIPTLCEKPLAPTVSAILRMQQAFESAGVPLCVAQSLRFKPSVLKAKELLAEGALGDFLGIRAYFTLTVPKNNWRYSSDFQGGVMQDIGVHLIDLIRFISGKEFCSISAIEHGKSESDCDTAVTGMGFLQGEIPFTFECSFEAPLRSGFEVIGSKGRLISENSLRQTYDPVETCVLVKEDGTRVQLPLKAVDIYAEELDHFARVLRGDVPSLLDSAEGLANQKIIEASYFSMNKKGGSIVSLL